MCKPNQVNGLQRETNYVRQRTEFLWFFLCKHVMVRVLRGLNK
jgi:hypothetical protein